MYCIVDIIRFNKTNWVMINILMNKNFYFILPLVFLFDSSFITHNLACSHICKQNQRHIINYYIRLPPSRLENHKESNLSKIIFI